jgi:hypothetical protein
MTLFDVTTYTACLSALIGVSLQTKATPVKIRALIVFQVVSCVCDLFLIYLIPMNDGWYVRLFYCFLRPIEYMIYVYVLIGFDIAQWDGKFSRITSVLIVLFSIYQLVFRLHEYDLTDQLMLIEGIFTITATLIYFRNILSDRAIGNSHFDNLWLNPEFWVATSLLFFFTGNILITGFYHRLYIHSESFTKLLYSYTNLILGIAQSVMFTIAYAAAWRLQLHKVK